MSLPRPATAIDRHVGARVKLRRLMLGLTQKQASALIGVRPQQWGKYETGENRIAAGRLAAIADGLVTEPAWFFEGLEDGKPVPSLPPGWLGLAQTFLALSQAHQQALLQLSRALAQPEDGKCLPSPGATTSPPSESERSAVVSLSGARSSA